MSCCGRNSHSHAPSMSGCCFNRRSSCSWSRNGVSKYQSKLRTLVKRAGQGDAEIGQEQQVTQKPNQAVEMCHCITRESQILQTQTLLANSELRQVSGRLTLSSPSLHLPAPACQELELHLMTNTLSLVSTSFCLKSRPFGRAAGWSVHPDTCSPL